MYRIYSRFLWAIATFVAVTILLCLPGSSLPKTEGHWFSTFQVDKIIHITMFATLVYMVCKPILLKGFFTQIISKIYLVIAIISTFYGFIMELVQKFFIPGRAFEWADVLADAIGCAIGYYISIKRLKKVKTELQTKFQSK